MVFPTGTVVNAVAIIIGSAIGMIIGEKMPKSIKNLVYQGLGLSIFILGIQMGIKTNEMLLLVFSLLLGGISGGLLKIEDNVSKFMEKLRRNILSKFGTDQRFVEGFVSSTMIVCVGSMAILGSLQDGLVGDPTILYTKAVLDFFIALALASSYGIGVMFSALPILLYQGSITVFANFLQPWLEGPLLNELTAVGGVLIVGIGINLLELRKINLLDLLPALLWVCILGQLFF